MRNDNVIVTDVGEPNYGRGAPRADPLSEKQKSKNLALDAVFSPSLRKYDASPPPTALYFKSFEGKAAASIVLRALFHFAKCALLLAAPHTGPASSQARRIESAADC